VGLAGRPPVAITAGMADDAAPNPDLPITHGQPARLVADGEATGLSADG
jgi:hypothetical protein